MKLSITALAILTSLVVHAQDKSPQPPKGYSWVRAEMIQSEVLKPDGWFVDQGQGWFTISNEKIIPGSFPKAAFTINVATIATNAPNAPKVSVFNEKTVNYLATKSVLQNRTQSTNGIFKVIQYRMRDNPKGGKDMTVHNCWIANDRTGKQIHIWFEAPTAEWESFWKTASPFFKDLRLNEKL